jgi:hypothetical protein
MAKLTGSECEMILKLAGDVIGDKGFIGTDYIITPVRKPKDRDLFMSEHEGYAKPQLLLARVSQGSLFRKLATRWVR